MARKTAIQPLNVALLPATPISRERLVAIAKLAEVNPLTLQAHRAGLTIRKATRLRIERALTQAAEIDTAVGLPGTPDPHDVRFLAAVERVLAGRDGGRP